MNPIIAKVDPAPCYSIIMHTFMFVNLLIGNVGKPRNLHLIGTDN